MDFYFDLQMFGGGGESSTTEREIPEQTENERMLENYLLNAAQRGGDLVPTMYKAFSDAAGNAFKPDLKKLYEEYVKRHESDLTGYSDYLVKALEDYSGEVGNYDSRMNAARRRYLSDTDRYLDQYEAAMGDAKAKYDMAQARRSPLWDDLVNGRLPAQYAINRQAALNADLKGTMGSAINNLATRGVINSGVGNKALDDISQSASDTLAKRYAEDLQLEAMLLDKDRANIRDAYDVASNYAGSLFGNQYLTAQGQYQANSNAFTNAMNQYANMYSQKANQANNWIGNVNQSTNDDWNAALQAQGASFQPAESYLNYAQTLLTPVMNLYNTMYSGRMGTGSTTTTQSSNGGMWSALGGLGAAAIMCFVGDTLVTTPDGYKAIKDISVGDTVLSVCEGKVTPKKVKSVTTPHESLIVNVYFDNGTVWRTTPHQRYFDGKHFSYFGNRHIPAMVYNGEPSRVLKVEPTDKREVVYDFAVEGFAGENVYFANDVAAEGFGD